MHWGFYVVAALVTALAIYVQMKRIEKTEKQNQQAESAPAPAEQKSSEREQSMPH
jgi:large-conductance mechanosensitive channel